MATPRGMNEFLFDRYEIAYIASHCIYTDHAQTWTGSAAVSYLWNGTRYSADVIYGSGPRNDFANTGHLPLYTQVNAGISHEFKLDDLAKPATLRFDILNVFDSIHEIRDAPASACLPRNMDPAGPITWTLAEVLAHQQPPTTHMLGQRKFAAMKHLSKLYKSLFLSALLTPAFAGVLLR
jgi:hypothetical protein